MTTMTGKQTSQLSQRLASLIESTAGDVERGQTSDSGLHTIGSIAAHHAVRAAFDSVADLQDSDLTQELLAKATRIYHSKLVKEARKDPFKRGLKDTLKEIFWDIESGVYQPHSIIFAKELPHV